MSRFTSSAYSGNIAANNSAPLPSSLSSNGYSLAPQRFGSIRVTDDDMAQAHEALNSTAAPVSFAAPSPTPTATPFQPIGGAAGMSGLAGLAGRLQGVSAQAYGQMPSAAAPAPTGTGGYGINPETGRPFTQAEIDAWGVATAPITVLGRPVGNGSMAGQGGTGMWGITPGTGSTSVRDAASRYTTSPEMSDFYGSRSIPFGQPDELFAPSRQVPWSDTKALSDWASRTSSAYPAWKGLGRR